MSITNSFDTDKSKYYSNNDYVTLSDYQYSFRNAQQTSQLRMVIAPGTVKYFNQQFTPQAIQLIQNPIYATQTKLSPITTNNDDTFDYMSYPKK